MKKIPLILLFLLTVCLSVHAETLTLSTYYPAPFGSYDRLRLVPRGAAPLCDASLEGTLYYADDPTNALNICRDDGTWGLMTGIWTQDAGDNVYLTNDDIDGDGTKAFVGIGTSSPSANLHIDGDGELMLQDTSVHMSFIIDPWGVSPCDDFRFSLYPSSTFLIESDVGSTGAFTTRMAITSDGKVGIGTPAPQEQLHLSGNGGNAGEVLLENTAAGASVGITFSVPTDTSDFFIKASHDRLLFLTDPNRTGALRRMCILPDGNVGIGTTNPESLLHLSAPSPVLYLKGSTGADYSATMRLAGENEDTWRGGYMQYDAGNDMLVIGVHDTGDKLTANDTKVILIDRATGNIGIGRIPDTTATDYELDVHGTIHAYGLDLAENILVEDNVGPGDVVVISEKGDKKLKKSDQPYDPKIAGVISTDPGFCLGDSKEGYQPLALTGQVPVKVTTENGPIKKGDLLTSSSKPGHAMKASFIPLENIEALPELTAALEKNRKRQLAIIGKALEELEEGEGTIIILMAR